jgi:CheY-like chemotaxis protein
VRKALAEMLGDLNYRVVTAGSGEEALELHAKLRAEISLVLTDLVMPGGGGLALLRMLRARDPGARVILMAGYENGELDAELPGVAAWVRKPATPQALGAVIRQTLTGASRQC